ncbi:ABC transporter ATP-binding protein [Evansella clarkii]|uniref:ABC transporter ATP-binding protein n=1 Tax=Evansella clarkii TaxID=79879 RepID=UPI0009964008|nr:ABC transporter ATP-binding protein [Evansella clarkii]
MERDVVIEVKNLKKTYKKRKGNEIIYALNGVNFNVYRGEILGLLGPNGAGKTTTIKSICGLIKPNGGAVLINEIDSNKSRLKALNYLSAVLEGNRNLYWRLTVRENLEYFVGNRGVNRKNEQGRVEELLLYFNLKEKENELVSSLSRGMQQKLAIAVALSANTEIILLDEPTLGLDVETGYEVRELLKRLVKEHGKTIIISTHDMPVVQDLCERTVIINNGKVIADEQVDNLIAFFDTRAYIFTLGEELTSQQRISLTENYPMCNINFNEIEVIIEKENDLYKIMDILKSEKTVIEKIDRSIVDIEQIFLKLTKEGSKE